MILWRLPHETIVAGILALVHSVRVAHIVGTLHDLLHIPLVTTVVAYSNSVLSYRCGSAAVATVLLWQG